MPAASATSHEAPSPRTPRRTPRRRTTHRADHAPPPATAPHAPGTWPVPPAPPPAPAPATAAVPSTQALPPATGNEEGNRPRDKPASMIKPRPAQQQMGNRVGELDEAGSGFPVAEHPSVLPGGVESAEILVVDPVPRLVRVPSQSPPVGELPQVVVQGSEHFLGHHRPVVG